jgi:hypothetical protein
MDTGAHQEAPDSGAPTSDAGTTGDAGASDKSAGIDLKGKGPAVPEVRIIPEPAPAGQATPAAPEQPAPKTPSSEKTPALTKATASAKATAPAKTTAQAKSGTLKFHPTKPGTPAAAIAPSKAAPRTSSALALHLGRAATRPGYRTSFFDTPELEGIVPLIRLKRIYNF